MQSIAYHNINNQACATIKPIFGLSNPPNKKSGEPQWVLIL